MNNIMAINLRVWRKCVMPLKKQMIKVDSWIIQKHKETHCATKSFATNKTHVTLRSSLLT